MVVYQEVPRIKMSLGFNKSQYQQNSFVDNNQPGVHVASCARYVRSAGGGTSCSHELHGVPETIQPTCHSAGTPVAVQQCCMHRSKLVVGAAELIVVQHCVVAWW